MKLKKGDGLYAVKYNLDKAPDKSKPWCVVNLATGDINGRWHPTKAMAQDQLKAMYANMGNKARYAMNESNFLVPLRFAEPKTDAAGITWLEALQARTFHTPIYGKVEVTPTKLQNLVKSFHDKVRGIDIVIDYDHGMDPAKGRKAAGWLKDVKVEGDKLLYGVQFTDTAKQEIDNGEWRYFSADWLDDYVHDDGTKHQDVIAGGGLTNRPLAKSLMPINFSEVVVEVDRLSDDTVKALVDEGTITAVHPAEFMEPGSGNLLPGTDIGSPNDDSIGDRIDPPPPAEDGSVPDRSGTVENNAQTKGGEMDEFEKSLRASLGVADDVDVSKYIADGLTELESLKSTARQMSEGRKFAEQYPEEYARMQALEAANREGAALLFSESLKDRRVVQPGKNEDGEDIETTTNLGLSGVALNAVAEVHKKFSEGTATLEDFTGVVENLFSGGIVEYGERGSTRGVMTEDDSIPTSSVDVRKKFSEAVDAVKKDDISYEQAIAIAAEKNPKLYEAYLTSRPA